jgi:hypothetical protein
LSETHEDGKHKAIFFTHFGFSVAEWETLSKALLAHAVDHEVTSTLDTQRGKHYVIEGDLQTPSGRSPLVRSVWAIDNNSTIPRLITAYPLKGSRDEEE